MPGAAAAFHLLASAAQRDRGESPSLASVAAVIGEHRQHWSAYVNGNVQPTDGKIAEWCRAWVAAGYEPIGITVDHEGWRPV